MCKVSTFMNNNEVKKTIYSWIGITEYRDLVRDLISARKMIYFSLTNVKQIIRMIKAYNNDENVILAKIMMCFRLNLKIKKNVIMVQKEK